MRRLKLHDACVRGNTCDCDRVFPVCRGDVDNVANTNDTTHLFVENIPRVGWDADPRELPTVESELACQEQRESPLPLQLPEIDADLSQRSIPTDHEWGA